MPDLKPEQLPTIKSKDFISVYSNSANLEITPWDFKFIFGALEKGEDGKPRIEKRVEIIMSPQHAKALLGIFGTHLTEYEKQVGEIKLPQPQQSPAQ